MQGWARIAFSPDAVCYDVAKENRYMKVLAGKLRSCCCGLIEVHYSSARGKLKEPKVDFFHRTVYDYLCHPQVSALVTKAYPLTQAETDLTLFLSCIHVLNRKIHASHYQWFSPDFLFDSFGACLTYSQRIEKLDWQSIDHTEASATSFYTACRQAVEASSYIIYERACDMLRLPKGFRVQSDELGQLHPASLPLLSALMVSQLDSPEYFDKDNRMLDAEPATKSLLLLHVLYLVSKTPASMSAHSTFNDSAIRNVEILIARGANPNTPASRLDTDHVPEIVRQTAILVQSDVVDIVPWNYWILVCKSTPLHFNITLQLLTAGAEVATRHHPKQLALNSLRHKLQDYAKDCSKTETDQVLQIISKMQGYENPLKRKNQEAHHIPFPASSLFS